MRMYEERIETEQTALVVWVLIPLCFNVQGFIKMRENFV